MRVSCLCGHAARSPRLASQANPGARPGYRLTRMHLTPVRRIITFMEARWKVPSNPARGGAFYSPWFGIESSDNLNLIQVCLPAPRAAPPHHH